jgi:REP element-mobilizing transposase RayT
MVLGSHVIISTYGFWLPNDPRGSWSDFVGAWELFAYGKATKVDTRRSVANVEHDRDLRRNAKQSLAYAPVRFTGVQARAVGRGFGSYVERGGIKIRACSILPQHAHFVIARHKFDVEQVVNQLKGYATRQLDAESLHPKCPSCWGRGLWKVFLNSPEAVARSMKYVEQNPLKEGLPIQHWPFVRPSIV